MRKHPDIANMRSSFFLVLIACSSSAISLSIDRLAMARNSLSPAKRDDTAPAQYEDQSLKSIIDDSPFLSFHRDLVQTPSISKDEAKVGSFIAEFLEAHNFTVVKQPVATSSSDSKADEKAPFNVFAYPSGSTPEDSQILLTSHIDVVPPYIPYSVRNGNKTGGSDSVIVSGRGSVDAKANVAAQVFAALERLSESPSTPLALLFVVDEEADGTGMRTFSANRTLYDPESSKYRGIIFGEPTDGALVSGHKGTLGFTVRSTGRAAHSGYPWLGSSAISSILPALSVLDKLGDIPPREGGLPSSEKYNQTTVNIGLIEGGVASNVVPASANATGLVRLAAGTHEDAAETITCAVRRSVAEIKDANVTVEFQRDDKGNILGYPPQDLDTDVSGFPIAAVNYGTDIPNLKVASSVKRYLYGPGSIHVAHSDHEALTVGELKDAVKGYKRLIDALASD